MSFITTTHNPLTLLGAKAGEIQILKNSGGALAVRPIDLPLGIRADQVLTGEWFGLSSTVDRDTRDKLEQHRQLLRAGADEHHEERRALAFELRNQLIG